MDCSPPGSSFMRESELNPSTPLFYLQFMHILQINILPTDHLLPSHIAITIYVLYYSLYIQLLLSVEGSGLVPLVLKTFTHHHKILYLLEHLWFILVTRHYIVDR